MCKCQICGRYYSVDLNASNELWDVIKPVDKEKEMGMIYRSCIMLQIETINQEHNSYRAFNLVEIK